MHAVFMAYGMKDKLDFFLGELEHHKLVMKATNDLTKKEEPRLIQCQLRTLPGGIYEFVFPKEHMDAVLTTLRFHLEPPYKLDKEIKIMGLKIKPLEYIKKYLRIEDPPEFKTDSMLPIIIQHVSIIPLGIRYDGEVIKEEGNDKGWRHEAI